MTEIDKVVYKILEFLNTPKTRRDTGISDGVLRNQFPDIDKKLYDRAFSILKTWGYIGMYPPNDNWEITELGEIVLEESKNRFNIISVKSLIKKYARGIGFLIGLIGTVGIIYQIYFGI